MRWKSARRSGNVEDRRGGGRGRKAAAGGGLMMVITIVGVLFFGGDPSQLLGLLTGGGGGGATTGAPARELTASEKEAGEFVEAVLGFTEDVWDQAYPRLAKSPKYRGAPATYKQPKLVIFTSEVTTACGKADSGVGPFYCPADDHVYIDLTFFNELATRFDAPGDFAQAYVIAHEVGHHVQNLIGMTRYVDSKRKTVSKEEYNQLSVRLELQADFFAGVWAHLAQEKFDILEKGDLEEGLGAASAVGDDTIQKRARGYVVPESFTHGTSAQRIRWFRLGLKSGDPLSHDPFSVKYSEL